MPAVHASDLHKKFQTVTALAGVSFSVEEGALFGLIGADGAGKTTLFRILVTLISADRGSAAVLGKNIEKELAEIRTLVGYMPQRFSLYQDLSVAENLRFFADLFGVGAAERRRRTEELLAFSRLGDFVKRRAGALSGGMKQKLALSCALIHTPKLLVLDEPTTGVDPVSRRDFWEMLERLRAQGVTIVVSTPYMNEAALCRRMVLIHGGSVLAAGNADEIARLFPGTIYALFGDDLRSISSRLRPSVPAEFVRILGDRVQVIVVEDARGAIEALIESMEREGLVARVAREVPPGVEDAFVALMRNR
jgi:ABC-2 type transport system ATP-binding protein